MKILFRVTNEFIESELKNGRVVKSEQSIDVVWSDLDQETRNMLVKHCVIDTDKEIALVGYNQLRERGYGSVSNHSLTLKCGGNTIQDILDQFSAVELEKIQGVAREKAEIEQRMADYLNLDIAKKTERRIFGEGYYSDWSGSMDYKGIETIYSQCEKKYGKFEIGIDQLIEKAMQIERKRNEVFAERAEKTRIDADEKAEREAERKRLIDELKSWAKKQGSELLQLRIKHEQNWVSIAEYEYAIAHSHRFEAWGGEVEDEQWVVKNATIEQLQLLEKAQKENPNCEIDIIRCKFIEKDEYGEYPEDYFHRTFLRCEVKVPTSKVFLYAEIEDAD